MPLEELVSEQNESVSTYCLRLELKFNDGGGNMPAFFRRASNTSTGIGTAPGHSVHCIGNVY